jgi:hypothetical protein
MLTFPNPEALQRLVRALKNVKQQLNIDERVKLGQLLDALLKEREMYATTSNRVIGIATSALREIEREYGRNVSPQLTKDVRRAIDDIERAARKK